MTTITDEAVCPMCGGSGACCTQTCCGNFFGVECCGDPDVEAEPCERCNGTGRILQAVSEHPTGREK